MTADEQKELDRLCIAVIAEKDPGETYRVGGRTESIPRAPRAGAQGQYRSAMRKLVRCPYCVEAGQFKVMTVHRDRQWSLCEGCGHLALRQSPTFQCTCAHCVRIDKAPKRRR